MADRTIAPTTLAGTITGSHTRRGGMSGDTVFRGLTTLFALLVLVVAVLMVGVIIYNSRTTLSKYGFSFLTGTVWDPNVKLVFGAAPYIFGTLVTSIIALILAGFVGVGIALMLVELHLPRWTSTPIAFLVEMIAAVPSVVIGVWGIFVLIPLMQQHIDPFFQDILGWTTLFGIDAGGGHTLFTAALLLGVMIVPTVAAISRDVIRVVPDSQREAMLALGATRWEMISKAVLPMARPGIIGALVLALGRAVGETIAATMVIGNAPYMGQDLLHSADTLASKIANNLGDAADLELSALFELGLILMGVSILLNVLARVLVWSVSRGSPQVA